jgi:hypothetical protein
MVAQIQGWFQFWFLATHSSQRLWNLKQVGFRTQTMKFTAGFPSCEKKRPNTTTPQAPLEIWNLHVNYCEILGRRITFLGKYLCFKNSFLGFAKIKQIDPSHHGLAIALEKHQSYLIKKHVFLLRLLFSPFAKLFVYCWNILV